jgi:hypothetical protein
MVSQDLIMKYLGNNPATIMLAGIGVLAIINLILALIVAYKSKTDSIKFHFLPDFMEPLLTYSVFLLMVSVLVLSTRGVPALSGIFVGLEYTGLATILMKYFYQGYLKLKQLGLPDDPNMDNVISKVVTEVTNNTATGGGITTTSTITTPISDTTTGTISTGTIGTSGTISGSITTADKTNGSTTLDTEQVLTGNHNEESDK